MQPAPVGESLRATFAPRFHLLSELGRGAMATVYLAHEAPKDRYVALKVLAERFHGTEEAARFRREARVLTTLRHPHILRAYDVGSAGPHDWYSMPFIAGESLRERLDRERRLRIDEACQLAIDILGALAHSHAFDIVHRDVKPDNVLLSAKGALLADFGIARRVELPDSAVPTVATAHGVTLGTPAYMSPEQIAAERSIDGRSDVYSTAVLLYECLSGSLPITGRTARDFMARHMTESPIPLAFAAPDVPRPIADAVQRGLEKSPHARFPTAEAFREALMQGRQQTATPQLKSFGIAAVTVSPFDFGGLPQDRWIAAGLFEAVVLSLRDRAARVVAPPGRRGVASRWHVRGACTVSEAQVFLSISVVDRDRAITQHLEPIEGHASIMTSLQDAAAREVCSFLSRHGLVGEHQPAALGDRSLLAEALYLRGRQRAEEATPAAWSDAMAHLDRAIADSPGHRRAIEARAGLMLQLALPGDADTLRQVIACADRALAIDAAAPTALYHKASALARLGEWSLAIQCLERAVAADPENQGAHYGLGRCRLLQALCTPVWEFLGRAVRPLARAIALDPGHLPSYRDLTAAYLYAGDDAQAANILQAADAMLQATPEPLVTPAPGLDLLRRYVNVVRTRHEAAEFLLMAVDGDPVSGLAGTAALCCSLQLAGDRTAFIETAHAHDSAAFSIHRANHLDPD